VTTPPPAKRTPPNGPPALDFADVTVLEWDRRSADPGVLFPILEGIDWTAGPGEQWAVLGANGAGKTTLLDVAAGMRHPTRGEVRILGERLGHVDVRELRTRIGHVDTRTEAAFAPVRPVMDVVLTGVSGSIAMLADRVEETDRVRALRLLELFGCGRLAGRQFGRCSQGERRRILLARALMHRPPLLLLDEPADGLDLPGREALLAALEAIAAEEPATTLVLVTHHLEELPKSATHALLLRDGGVSAQGPVETVLADGPLSDCFGVAVRVRLHDGRWSGRAGPHW
jgi:iron complex transport system ATP-binding protein